MNDSPYHQEIFTVDCISIDGCIAALQPPTPGSSYLLLTAKDSEDKTGGWQQAEMLSAQATVPTLPLPWLGLPLPAPWLSLCHQGLSAHSTFLGSSDMLLQGWWPLCCAWEDRRSHTGGNRAMGNPRSSGMVVGGFPHLGPSHS